MLGSLSELAGFCRGWMSGESLRLEYDARLRERCQPAEVGWFRCGQPPSLRFCHASDFFVKVVPDIADAILTRSCPGQCFPITLKNQTELQSVQAPPTTKRTFITNQMNQNPEKPAAETKPRNEVSNGANGASEVITASNGLPAALTAEEISELQKCEAVITHGWATFVEVGRALHDQNAR